MMKIESVCNWHTGLEDNADVSLSSVVEQQNCIFVNVSLDKKRTKIKN